jgi:hypothetical protein
MPIQSVIQSQYHAALAMLRQAIEKCPNALWASTSYNNAFWHIAYHTLIYTHFYLHTAEADFAPWEKCHLELRTFDIPSEDLPPITKTEVLDFLDLCLHFMEEQLQNIDLAAKSGFDWLPFNKLELQLYNIRHIQQHTGELCERLGAHGDVEVDWVGMRH